jgi:hypothetical protein
MRKTMTKGDFLSRCGYNAESNGILKATEAVGDKIDLTGIRMYPCVVPDRSVSNQTWSAAIAVSNCMLERNRKPEKKKAWWKFW